MPRWPAPLAVALVLGGLLPPATSLADDDASVRSPSREPCAPDAGPSCLVYERYVNAKFAFSVDVPTFFTRKGADADGRGQPFAYGTKARARAWAMYNVPQMSLAQLYADWTRRPGVTFQALAMNTWIVRGKDEGRFYYSRSVLVDGIIATIEVSYDPSLADVFEPVLARMGPSLQVLPDQPPKAK